MHHDDDVTVVLLRGGFITAVAYAVEYAAAYVLLDLPIALLPINDAHSVPESNYKLLVLLM